MKSLYLLLLILLLTMPLYWANAQETKIPQKLSEIPDSLKSIGGFLDWFDTIMFSFFLFLGIAAVIVILYSAALFMFSGDEKREKAKAYLKWGIVGIIVAIAAGSIITLILNVLRGK